MLIFSGCCGIVKRNLLIVIEVFVGISINLFVVYLYIFIADNIGDIYKITMYTLIEIPIKFLTKSNCFLNNDATINV